MRRDDQGKCRVRLTINVLVASLLAACFVINPSYFQPFRVISRIFHCRFSYSAKIFNPLTIYFLQLNQRNLQLNANLRSIASGSWGCGGQQAGEPQFKLVIQWLAASVANVPTLIYYTCAKESLSKLDTVVRVLHGRFRLPVEFACGF